MVPILMADSGLPLGEFLEYLPSAARSGPAFVAYLALVGAWVFTSVQRQKYQAVRGLRGPHAKEMLETIIDKKLPKTITAEQYLRDKDTQRVFLLALAIIGVVLVLGVMSAQRKDAAAREEAEKAKQAREEAEKAKKAQLEEEDRSRIERQKVQDTLDKAKEEARQAKEENRRTQANILAAISQVQTTLNSQYVGAAQNPVLAAQFQNQVATLPPDIRDRAYRQVGPGGATFVALGGQSLALSPNTVVALAPNGDTPSQLATIADSARATTVEVVLPDGSRGHVIGQLRVVQPSPSQAVPVSTKQPTVPTPTDSVCLGDCQKHKQAADAYCDDCKRHCGETGTECVSTCGSPWDVDPCLKRAGYEQDACFHNCKGNSACAANCQTRYRQEQVPACYGTKKMKDEQFSVCMSRCEGLKGCRDAWCDGNHPERDRCHAEVQTANDACQNACRGAGPQCSNEEKCDGPIRTARCASTLKVTGYCTSWNW